VAGVSRSAGIGDRYFIFLSRLIILDFSVILSLQIE